MVPVRGKKPHEEGTGDGQKDGWDGAQRAPHSTTVQFCASPRLHATSGWLRRSAVHAQQDRSGSAANTHAKPLGTLCEISPWPQANTQSLGRHPDTSQGVGLRSLQPFAARGIELATTQVGGVRASGSGAAIFPSQTRFAPSRCPGRLPQGQDHSQRLALGEERGSHRPLRSQALAGSKGGRATPALLTSSPKVSVLSESENSSQR